MSESEPKRVVPVTHEDLTRVFSDDEAATYHFDHAGSVTLVAEKNRRKWESKDREEDAGSVFFLSTDERQQIKHSETGVFVGEGVLLLREASVNNERWKA